MSDVTGGFGHDEVGKFGAFGLVFGEDKLAGESVGNVDASDGVLVDVAFIFDSGGKSDGGIGRKAGDFIGDDGAFASDFAADIGVNDTGELVDVVDGGGVCFGGNNGRVGTDEEGGILAATVDVFGDGDSIINLYVFIGMDDAGGVFNGNPIGDFGEEITGGKVGGVVGADDIVGSDGD